MTWYTPERLPKGGPDRVRLAVLYGDYFKAEVDHKKALGDALGCINILHMYVAGGIAEKLGATCGGIPIEFLGEEMSPPK